MEYRYHGVTASLTLITVVALIVSFSASAQRHRSEDKLLQLQSRIDSLRQANGELEEKVRWIEGQYGRTRTLGLRLNAALLEEQTENRLLREQLRQHRQKAARDVQRQEGLRAALGAAAQGALRFSPERLGDRIPLASADKVQ